MTDQGKVFRKIYTCIWNDQKFHSLSNEGKLAFLYLLTHPQMTSLGVIRAKSISLSHELEVFPEAFQEVFSKGLAEESQEASCIYVFNFLKYQTPQSPNVIKAWKKSIDSIPECGLKDKSIQDAKALTEGMTEAFQKAFREAFGKTIGNKEKGERRKEKPTIYIGQGYYDSDPTIETLFEGGIS